MKDNYMKSFFFILLVVLSVGCGSTEQSLPKYEPYSGVISASQLISQYPQFRSAYDQYQPSSVEVDAIKLLSGKTLLVLFGTWCHDSKREVPKLLKLIDLSGVELESLSLHGVNYNKQEPTNLHRQYDLKYSPTIILLQGEVELGRIVEKPMVSLGVDLASFVSEQ
jgi:thioredoxin 1